METRRSAPVTLTMEESPPHESWTNWFRQHSSQLLLCARQWTRSVADAEDVLQEAFVRFWKHQRQLGGDPTGLLVTSMRRAAIDLARRNQRRAIRESAIEPLDDDGLFEPLAEDDDRRVAIEQAIRALPVEQREVLVMKIWGERTFEQMATELNLSPNTVASRYRYALSGLRKQLLAPDRHA